MTKTGVDMPASENTLLYEYNVDFAQKKIWWDLSAVDGLNANATMTYEGPRCGQNCGCDSAMPKVCKTNLAAFDKNNPSLDGCPNIMQFAGANSCPNPKFYTSLSTGDHPAWVVTTSNFTTDQVASQHAAIWAAAGSPSGAEMASAASGEANPKKAYHIWWATNPVGQGWLSYLQQNAAGTCNAYGWAYDEMIWHPGDSFDSNGNPVKPNGNPDENTAIAANVACDFSPNTYLNIDILYVL